jgi:hypothetical protein
MVWRSGHFLFQLSQTVFGGLCGSPLHDQAPDKGLLLREDFLEFSAFTIGACPTKSLVVVR